MKKIILSIILLLGLTAKVMAQDINSSYDITIWNKDLKGQYVESHLQTLGYLPVFKNTQDEITIGNIKLIFKSYLNIQVLENKSNVMKVLLDFKNDNKEYKKEIEITNNELKDLEDFKIKIEKK